MVGYIIFSLRVYQEGNAGPARMIVQSQAACRAILLTNHQPQQCAGYAYINKL